MTANTSHKIEYSYIGTFLLSALFIGFALGTPLLLGPVRWTIRSLRARQASEGMETWTVLGFILLLLIVTLVCASAAATYLWGDAPRWKRAVLAATIISLALVANFLWTSPALMKRNMGAEEDVAMFTFGPYPDESKLRELKKRGFAGVISLLHPAVIPFEPKLLDDEKKNARRAGIDLIHAPMLPWVSDNVGSIERIREIVKTKPGRYYVHCYLGMDRVMVVKRLVQREGAVAAGLESTSTRPPLEDRTFERGKVSRLDKTLYVGPYPTPDELFEIASSRVAHVVTLVDSAEPDAAMRLDSMKSALKSLALTHSVINLNTTDYDANLMLRAAEQVRRIADVTYVYEFFGPETGRAPLASAFMVAYRTRRAPIMPLLIDVPLQAGPVRLLDVDVAAGPRPQCSEFGGRLREAGIKVFVCVDPDRGVCHEQACGGERINLLAARNEGELEEIFRGRGPFYFYSATEAQPGEIVERLAGRRAQTISGAPAGALASRDPGAQP
jgi:protein tyrosine phosphatase (PTP) superfamily phosphohydrolase (DUF442 family)